MQRADPLAHKVYPITQELIRKISMRFLKPAVIRQGITKVLADEENLLPLESIFIGFTTKGLLNKKLSNGDITQEGYNNCLRGAQEFYRTSLQYVLKKMVMAGTPWVHAVWIDFFKRGEASWSDVEYFIENFKSVLRFDEHEINALYGQFVDYQLINTSELPRDTLDDATLHRLEDGTVEYRIDVIWYHLRQLRSSIGNNLRFHLLFQVARIVLLIPRSNAGIKRVFTLVNKNKNESSDRNRLNQEGSLSAILAVELDSPEEKAKCFNFQPDKVLLDKAKKATVSYNEEHSSKS